MPSLFNSLQLVFDGHDYFLQQQGQSRRFYSQRSLAREGRLLAQKLAAGNERLLVYIAPFHEQIYQCLSASEKKQLLWLSPTLPASGQLPPEDNIFFSEDSWQARLREISSQDRFELSLHPLLAGFDWLLAETQNSLKQAAQRLKTIAHFGKIWEYNFACNARRWQSLPDIAAQKWQKPDIFILGGPSVDRLLANGQLQNKTIWCADTAVAVLWQQGLLPDLVFSLDAGHGSFEHFQAGRFGRQLAQTSIVLDVLSFPALYRQPFGAIYSYASSYPPAQALPTDKTPLFNASGDVFGLMQALYRYLFKEENLPQLAGRDRGHRRHITHLRGSAYHRRQLFLANRLAPAESYFFRLSQTLYQQLD